MLNGSSAVKRESLTLSNISCTTESQRQLFKCILRGHVKLGEKGNAFLRNVRNRIHINLLHMLKEMSPNVLYSTRLKACIQCTNFDSEGYGKVAICKNQRIYQLYRGADKSLARPGRKQARRHVRDSHDFNNIETRAVVKVFFLQGKAPKEIHAILTETLACFRPGRAKNLSAPLYNAVILVNCLTKLAFLIARLRLSVLNLEKFYIGQ